MSAIYLSINPDNPQERLILKAVECLRRDGVIIYPTDTVYAIGCDINNKKAIERLCRIKGIRPEKARLSCICQEIGIIGEYALHVSNETFKIMKRALPGPFTFILEASKNIPRHFQSPGKTVGIRIPNHNIPIAIVKELGNPIVTTSLSPDEIFEEYPVDPELIFEEYKSRVDIVINGGIGKTTPSTILDCSDEKKIILIRNGAGDPKEIGIQLEE